MNTQTINLDLAKRTGNQQITIAQGDFEGTTIVATIYDNGTKLAETGVTAKFLMQLPDGLHYVRDDATYDDGVITYVVDESHAASVHGFTDNAYFELHKGDTIASTERFSIIVAQCAYDGMDPGETYDTEIIQVLEELHEAVEAAGDATDAATDAADAASSAALAATDAAALAETAAARASSLWSNRPSAIIAGSLVTADDAAHATPIALSVHGQSTQDGTPTPSNPVPIMSVEGDASGNISLVACGRNLLDFASAASSSKQGVVMAPDADGWISVSGKSTATSATLLTMWGSNSSDILPPGTYTMKVETSGTPFVASKVRLQVNGTDSTTENHYYEAAGAYTFTYDGPIHRIAVYMSSTSTDVEVDGRFRLTLVSGTTTPTAYIPYVGSVTPIDLDGHELRSLPDGTRDELTVDAEGHVTLVQRVGVVSYDGSESWSKVSDRNIYYRTAWTSATMSTIPASSMSALCDHAAFTIATNASMQDGTFKLHTPSNDTSTEQFYFMNESAASVVDFKTWLTSNPITTYFKLPPDGYVTHDLGTVPLVPLVGPDLTAQTVPVAPLALTYERDTTIVLDRLTAMWANVAPVEGDTASASYSVGSYLMHGGRLCKVTTAIATGEAITIGTNVTATTVMAEVIALTQ